MCLILLSNVFMLFVSGQLVALTQHQGVSIVQQVKLLFDFFNHSCNAAHVVNDFSCYKVPYELHTLLSPNYDYLKFKV